MARLIPCGRDRALLLPLVVVAAVGRMPAGTVAVGPIPGGGAQDRPRRPLALPISRRASGIFSSRRIERATRRDLGVRCVAANPLPDHDTLAAFTRFRLRGPTDAAAAWPRSCRADACSRRRRRRAGLMPPPPGSSCAFRMAARPISGIAHGANPLACELSDRLRRTGSFRAMPAEGSAMNPFVSQT